MVIKKVYKEWFNNGKIKHDYHEEIKPDGGIIDYYKEYFSNGQIKKNRFYDSGFYFHHLLMMLSLLKILKGMRSFLTGNLMLLVI